MIISKMVDIYAVYYPIVLSFIWASGAFLSRWKDKRRARGLNDREKISIVISAYNEEETIEEVLLSLRNLNYPALEIFVVDVKSSDRTLQKLHAFKRRFNNWEALTILEQKENKGKATALNVALNQVTSKYMLVIDADSYLSADALDYLLAELVSDSRNGAVTGRPIVRNRTTLLGKLQTVEYLSVIDAIKRVQSLFLGAIMTVSGVIVMYRVEALKEIGGFDTEVMTEDIDVTWRLHKQNWKVKYVPKALSYILVPENLKSLVKQRRRWAVGGVEVLISNFSWVFKRGDFKHRFLLFEMICSHIWSWFFLIESYQYFLQMLLNQEFKVSGQIIVIFVLISFAVFFLGLNNDRGESKLSLSDKMILPVYLVAYWILNLVSAISAEIVVLSNRTNKGKWESPDRGI
ncbi:glycosyltransferase family 2 protein [Lactococcus cremoris]